MENPRDPLSERDGAILTVVVREFIRTGRPVSSTRVTAHTDLGLSSASVRIVMSRLEEKGWLTHPHTSAGRVPTDQGYRFYVDRLTQEAGLLEEEEDQGILSSLHEEEANAEDIFRAATRLLASLSSYFSIVLRPCLEELVCESVDLLYVRAHKVMLVVTTEAQLVHVSALDFGGPADRRDVKLVSEFLHGLCSGHRLGDLVEVIREGVHLNRFTGSKSSLAAAVIDKGLHRLEKRSISWDGTPCLARHPEFSAVDELEGLLEALEQGRSIVEILETVGKVGGCAVRIGEEMRPGPFSRCSLVASAYGIGNRPLGALAILGPRRMRYGKAVSMVRSLSLALSARLMQRGSPGLS